MSNEVKAFDPYFEGSVTVMLKLVYKAYLTKNGIQKIEDPINPDSDTTMESMRCKFVNSNTEFTCNFDRVEDDTTVRFVLDGSNELSEEEIQICGNLISEMSEDGICFYVENEDDTFAFDDLFYPDLKSEIIEDETNENDTEGLIDGEVETVSDDDYKAMSKNMKEMSVHTSVKIVKAKDLLATLKNTSIKKEIEEKVEEVVEKVVEKVVNEVTPAKVVLIETSETPSEYADIITPKSKTIYDNVERKQKKTRQKKEENTVSEPKVKKVKKGVKINTQKITDPLWVAMVKEMKSLNLPFEIKNRIRVNRYRAEHKYGSDFAKYAVEFARETIAKYQATGQID